MLIINLFSSSKTMVSLFFFFVTETCCDTSVKFKSCFTHFEEVPEQSCVLINIKLDLNITFPTLEVKYKRLN